MKKILKFGALVSIISTLAMSCSKNSAVYEHSEDFGKLSVDQALSKVLNQTDNLKGPIASRVRSDFDWDMFWIKLALALEKKEGNINDLKNLLSMASRKCNRDTKNSIYKIILNVKKVEKKYLIMNKVAELQMYCNGETEKLIVEGIQAELRNEFYFDFDTNASSKIKTLIEIDSSFNQELASPFERSHSLSPQELAGVGVKLIENGKLSAAIEYMDIHREMYQGSSEFRKNVLGSVINDDEKFELVIRKNTFPEISSFLRDFFIKDSVRLSKKQFELIFNSLYRELVQKYDKEDPYRMYISTFNKYLVDYMSLFKMLKNVKYDNRKSILMTFNKFNKLTNQILSRDLDLALNVLQNFNGEDKALSYFHEVTLKQNLTKGQVHNEFTNIIADETALDKLLLKRLDLIFNTTFESYDQFCNLLEVEFETGIKSIEAVQINSLLALNNIGCFVVNQSTNIEDDYYHEININKNRIDTYFDLAIKINDTDISITSKYYDGPIWALTTKRKHPQYEIEPEYKLNGRFIPILLDIKLKSDLSDIYKAGQWILPFNYLSKYPQKVPSVDQVVLDLKTGFRGGNLTLTYEGLGSSYPLLFGKGGPGQNGPKTLMAGQGIDQEHIEDTFFNLLPESRQEFFIDPDQRLMRKMYERDPEITIDWELTRALAKKLCGDNSDIGGLTLCMVDGTTYEVVELKVGEGGIVEYFRQRVKALFSLRDNKYFNQFFKFSPVFLDEYGETIFPNGSEGTSGKVKLNRL